MVESVVVREAGELELVDRDVDAVGIPAQLREIGKSAVLRGVEAVHLREAVERVGIVGDRQEEVRLLGGEV